MLLNRNIVGWLGYEHAVSQMLLVLHIVFTATVITLRSLPKMLHTQIPVLSIYILVIQNNVSNTS